MLGSLFSREKKPENGRYERIRDHVETMFRPSKKGNEVAGFCARIQSSASLLTGRNPKDVFKRAVVEQPSFDYDALDNDVKEAFERFFETSSITLFTTLGSPDLHITASHVFDAQNVQAALKSVGVAKYGHGVLLKSGNEYRIVTNAHVLADLDSRDEVKRACTTDVARTLDIAMYRVDEAYIRSMQLDPREIIDLTQTKRRGLSLSGHPVCVRGVDVASVASYGSAHIHSKQKTWGSVALALTESLRKGARFRLFGDSTTAGKFIFRVPEGEVRTVKKQGGGMMSRASGMSGAAIAAIEIHNGRPEAVFAGICRSVHHRSRDEDEREGALPRDGDDIVIAMDAGTIEKAMNNPLLVFDPY